MISVEDAIRFGNDNFPESPERLAIKLAVDVRYSAMGGCDGWCLTVGTKSIIRINSNLSALRQRFTLAHELGHLILGVPAVVGESFEDMLRSNSEEERQVNELASELLIPRDVVRNSLQSLPIVAMELRKLAKKANVSELATAIRVCNLAAEVGLVNASVVSFEYNDAVKWQWSKTLTMTGAEAVGYLRGARDAAPKAHRVEQENDVVVASILENPYFGSTTMFVQLLPTDVGLSLSRHEKRARFEAMLFRDDAKLQQRMSGYMGALKTRIAGKSIEEVEQDFWGRYRETLKSTTLNTVEGREYVRLRIEEWF
jgi:Zn-dependent peptidase ImmA (M78 family)